jgi:hypothetical protein
MEEDAEGKMNSKSVVSVLRKHFLYNLCLFEVGNEVQTKLSPQEKWLTCPWTPVLWVLNNLHEFLGQPVSASPGH